jgi:hypothetical protein
MESVPIPLSHILLDATRPLLPSPWDVTAATRSFRARRAFWSVLRREEHSRGRVQGAYWYTSFLHVPHLTLGSFAQHRTGPQRNSLVCAFLVRHSCPFVRSFAMHTRGHPLRGGSNLAPGMSAALIGSPRLFCPIQIISCTALRLAMRPSAARILCSTGLCHPHWASYITSACIIRFLAFLHTPLHRPWYLYCGTYADPSIGPSPELL